jgi:AcrR family transcriptional regulator
MFFVYSLDMQETKGQTTKNHILREGLNLASVNGLINISIGGLATKANMSRSGLFAHFLSKEQLQIEILEFAFNILEETIMTPTRQIESPINRFEYIRKELPHWYNRITPKIPGGCIFIMASLEFDDRPGKVRDKLLEQQNKFISFIKETHDDAISKNEFIGNSDRDHFAFTLYSIYMGYQQYKKFFGDENALKHFNHIYTQLIGHCQGKEILKD